MQFRNLSFATVAFSLCFLAVGPALAVAPQRTFVATYGLDTNPCSVSAPCRGFQAAIDAVAAGGEVVALDSGGYGAMEIHKSVSVIVPTGIHAGLSPSTGIPLPSNPNQSCVVLIDILDTDVVVLRGLNINHQGTVSGGIEWISANGGTVYVEKSVINGFPKEGIYVQAPKATLIVKETDLRNNFVGIYAGIAGGGRGFADPGGILADHVRIEHSTTGVFILSDVGIILSNCEIASNNVGFNVQSTTGSTSTVRVDRCSITRNASLFTIFGQGGGPQGRPFAIWEAAASTLNYNGPGTKSGATRVNSYGNNSLEFLSLFDSALPPQ